MAKASGKGISAAVRSTVASWMDDDAVQDIVSILNKSNSTSSWLLGRQLRNQDNWVRSKRYSYYGGFVRPYRNKMISDEDELVLEVRTDEKDSVIESFTVRVAGKVVAGGDCKVPSVLLDKRVSKPQITKKSVVVPPKFRKMTAAEMARFDAKQANSDGLERLFDERS